MPKAVGSRNRQVIDLIGAGERTRTADLLITNQLLYQLSYAGLKGSSKQAILARDTLLGRDPLRCRQQALRLLRQ